MTSTYKDKRSSTVAQNKSDFDRNFYWVSGCVIEIKIARNGRITNYLKVGVFFLCPDDSQYSLVYGNFH